MPIAKEHLEKLVLGIHRRNGGSLSILDLNCRLQDPALGLDSLDLAEIMAAIERDFGWSPFESNPPPRTWSEVVVGIQSRPIKPEQP